MKEKIVLVMLHSFLVGANLTTFLYNFDWVCFVLMFLCAFCAFINVKDIWQKCTT